MAEDQYNEQDENFIARRQLRKITRDITATAIEDGDLVIVRMSASNALKRHVSEGVREQIGKQCGVLMIPHDVVVEVVAIPDKALIVLHNVGVTDPKRIGQMAETIRKQFHDHLGRDVLVALPSGDKQTIEVIAPKTPPEVDTAPVNDAIERVMGTLGAAKLLGGNASALAWDRVVVALNNIKVRFNLELPDDETATDRDPGPDGVRAEGAAGSADVPGGNAGSAGPPVGSSVSAALGRPRVQGPWRSS